MWEEGLPCFHGDAVTGCDGDHEGSVFPARECPVVGRVGEATREREVGHEVSPVVEFDKLDGDLKRPEMCFPSVCWASSAGGGSIR